MNIPTAYPRSTAPSALDLWGDAVLVDEKTLSTTQGFGRGPGATLISESGRYALILRSRKPAVRASVSNTYAFGGRGSPPRLVNESGLYALIFNSRRPEARAFKRWVNLLHPAEPITPAMLALIAPDLLDEHSPEWRQ